jgi:hypothetical protein
MKPTRLSTTMLPILLALLIAPPALTAPQDIPERDVEKLGGQLADYIEARNEKKGRADAEQELREALAKLQDKRLKGSDPLSRPAALGQAIWHSKKYSKQKGIKKGKVSDMRVEDPPAFYGKDFEIEYAIHAPSSYRASKGPYAVILCIPDVGETPGQHLIEQWLDNSLREEVIVVACPMPEDTSLWTEIGSPGQLGGVGSILTVFRDVTTRYAVDFDRIYLAGRGPGVASAAAIANRSPHRFAALIGRTGDLGAMEARNFRNLPTWFAGGGAGVSDFEKAIKDLGYDNCTVVPGGTDADLLPWLKQNPRSSNPLEISLVPGSPIPNCAYWLEVPPWDGVGTASIEARIDQDTNTVHIEALGISQVTLRFNDMLLDMDKEITVICNGASNRDLIPRSLRTTLELIYKSSSDPGKVYVATRTYDIPSEDKSGAEGG